MSVTNANLPVLIIQLPHLARVSAVDQNHPEMQAALAEELARQEAERQREKIQSTEKPEAPKQLKKEDKGSSGQQHSGRRKKEKSEEEREEPAHTTPWSGHIINTKI